MLRTTLVAGLALATAIPVSAQSFTTPKGLEKREGNAVFFLSTNRRFQIIDATNKGTTLVVNFWRMRQDNRTQASGPGNVDATLLVGDGNLSHVVTDYNNFIGTPVTAFPKKTVKFPDWTKAPTPAPGPFDFVLPFQKPWIYLGKDALIWDLTLQNGASTANVVDREYVSTLVRRTGTAIAGSGCGGFTHTQGLWNSGSGAKNHGMIMEVSSTSAPASAPVLLSLDVKDSNLTVQGWCSKVHAAPQVLVPLGTANSTGRIFGTYFSVPFSAGFVSAPVFTQMVSTNAQGIFLSDGRSNTMPTQTATNGYDATYIWKSLTGSTNFAFYGGCIIAELSTK